jgi:hypothetical protein
MGIPIGPRTKEVYFVGNRVPFGMQAWRGLLCSNTVADSEQRLAALNVSPLEQIFTLMLWRLVLGQVVKPLDNNPNEIEV